MDLRKKFKLDYATFLQMSQCLASKLRDEFNPDIIACVARGGLSFSHVLSLELGIPCVMYEPGVYYPDKNVLVVDDSVGTGATLESIHEECNYARWTFAAFYADESYGGVHPVDFCNALGRSRQDSTRRQKILVPGWNRPISKTH